MSKNFSDYLSPAMVNDLRRTLHNKGYLSTQIFLLLAQWLYHLYQSQHEDPSIYGLPLLMLFVSLCLLIPGRVGKIVQHDTKHAGTNFMRLTPLSSRRIVWGLWASSLVHILAITLTALPLILYRHLEFGTAWQMEAATLGSCALFSLMLSGFFMYTAGLTSILRLLIHISLLSPVITCLGAWDNFSIFNIPTSTLHLYFIWGIINGGILLAILLELSRRYYALPAENCSVNLRLLSLSPLILAGIMPFLPLEFMHTIITPLQWSTLHILQLCAGCAIALFGALNDALLPSWDLNIRRYSKLPAALRVLIQPGSLGAAIYLMLVLIAGCVICHCLNNPNGVMKPYVVQFWLCLGISLFFCLLLTDLFTKRNNNNRPTIFLAIGLLASVFFLILRIFLLTSPYRDHQAEIALYLPVVNIGDAATAYLFTDTINQGMLDNIGIHCPETQLIGCSILLCILFLIQCLHSSTSRR